MTDTLTDLEDFPQKGLVAPRYMGTLADQKDMSALGRVQVLRVSIPCELFHPMNRLTREKEKFQIYFHCWIWLHADLHMGGYLDVCHPFHMVSLRASSWR